ncbi:hypothetical protein EV182_006470, partial [Spiromyces aspiralis]
FTDISRALNDIYADSLHRPIIPSRSARGSSQGAASDSSVVQDLYKCHTDTVFEVVPDKGFHGFGHVFFDCSDDGTVNCYDRRQCSSCTCSESAIFGREFVCCRNNTYLDVRKVSPNRRFSRGNASLGVTSIDIDPNRPHLLAIGCSDLTLRIYDQRYRPTPVFDSDDRWASGDYEMKTYLANPAYTFMPNTFHASMGARGRRSARQRAAQHFEGDSRTRRAGSLHEGLNGDGSEGAAYQGSDRGDSFEMNLPSNTDYEERDNSSSSSSSSSSSDSSKSYEDNSDYDNESDEDDDEDNDEYDLEGLQGFMLDNESLITSVRFDPTPHWGKE